MAYKYTPTQPNPYRKKKGFEGSDWLQPGAWKAALGETWEEGLEDFYNRGLVKNLADLLEKIQNPEQREELFKQVERQDRSKGQKIRDWFGKVGAKIGEVAQKVKDFITPEIEDSTERAQRNFQESMLALAGQNLPQEVERIKALRDQPYLTQAFGPLGGNIAQGLNTTLLAQMAREPVSRFPGSGGSQDMSSALLGSLLGSLGSHYLPQGIEAAQKYGPPALSYLQQRAPEAAQYLQGKGRSALGYLRNLI